MAVLYVTEFRGQEPDRREQAAPMPPIAEQAVTFSTSTASSAFNTQTRLVRILADANCHVEVGSAPTATTSNMYLPAGVPEYFTVQPGDKIAAVTA